MKCAVWITARGKSAETMTAMLKGLLVSHLLPAALAACSGTICHGGDLGPALALPSHAACSAACNASAVCVAYVFDGCGNAPACHLKRELLPKRCEPRPCACTASNGREVARQTTALAAPPPPPCATCQSTTTWVRSQVAEPTLLENVCQGPNSLPASAL